MYSVHATGVFLVLLIGTVIIMSDTEEEAKEEQRAYKKLVGTIGGHKGFLTKLAGNVASYDDMETLEGEARIEAEQLKVTIEERLVTLQNKFDELLENSHTTEADINDFELYTRGITSRLAKIKFKLKTPEKIVVTNTGISSRPPTPTGGWGESAIKYPELSLPKFYGGETGERDFRPFKQLFEALVGNKYEIPQIYKVQYLRESLPDGSEAKKLIAHIPPTEENYDLIMGTLSSRYGNNSGEANRLRRILMEVGDWHICHTIESQRRLIDHVRQNLALLDQLEQVTSEEMATLALNMLAVVPERIRYKVQKLEKSDRTVDNIVNILEKAITSKLEVQSFSPNYNSQTYGTAKAANYSYGGQGNKYPNTKFDYTKPNTNSNSSGGTHFANNTNQRHAKKVDINHSSSNSSSGADRSVLPCVYCKKSDPIHRGHFCHDKPNAEACKLLLMRERRCLNCLETGHMVRECHLATQCGCGKGKHSPSICFRGGMRSQQKKGGYVAMPHGSYPKFLATALSQVIHPITGESCPVRIFLDHGSTDSFCTTSIAQRLGCEPLGCQNVHIGVFGTTKTSTISNSSIVELNISILDGTTIPVQLLTTDIVCGDLPANPLSPDEIKQLSAFQLADYPATQYHALHVDVLIGLDFLWEFMLRGIEKVGFGPCLLESKLGWVLSGPLSGRSSKREFSANLIRTYVCINNPVSCYDLDNMLHRFWDLDTLGIKDEEESPVVAHFHEHVTRTAEGRVQVSIPWKEDIKPYLPVNYHQAVIRLGQTRRKLERPGNELLKNEYEKIIAEQLKDGIIEKVPYQSEHLFVNGQPEPDSIDINTAIIGTNTSTCKVRSYMPHHAVIKPESGKVRIVSDASCQAYQGALSLNDVIHGGPSLLVDLAETLMNFRIHNVAIVADIQKAYLALALNPDDRDAFRFLWYEGDETVEYRFARVPFGVIVSSFLLHAVLQSHFHRELESDPELMEKVLKSFYVDDLLSGAKDVEAADALRKRLEDILGKIGMNLHGWNSSSQVLREMWDAPVGEVLHVLGLLWDPVADSLMVNVTRVLGSIDCRPTKRNLLSLTASVFDPLGFLQPFLVLPKLMFQEICKGKVGWRGSLPEEMQVKWDTWKQQLSLLTSINVPRPIVVPEYDRVELHCFCDASEVAYAACCYIRCVHGHDVSVNLAFAKNRIAPLASHTLPRLELLGAGLLARITTKVLTVYKHLAFSAVVYYTDSKNVLHWIQSDNRNWSIFVLNRVLELHKLTKAKDWKYVRSERNPADIATRPVSGRDFAESKMWLYGPTFLYDETIDSGDKIMVNQPTPGCLAERKIMAKVAVVKPAAILDLDRYSSYEQVINNTRFAYMWLMKVPRFSPDGPPSFMQLYNMAVRYWVRMDQRTHYPTEVDKCPEGSYLGDQVAAVSSIARSLRLFKDRDGLLRYSSRVQDPFTSYNTNNPIILGKSSKFARLYMAHLHRILVHAGVGQLLIHFRKDFWVPAARQLARSVIHKCIKCQKVGAKTFPTVAPPPLPNFRVTPSEPFECTGIDSAGPINYKSGRSTKSGHILVFTCATTRAVAFEFVTGLSVEQVTLGLRRFFSRYGLPQNIQSDNHKTFKRCQLELHTILKSPKIVKYLSGHRIVWNRYLERSPWWGGYIERQVQTVKRSLQKVIGSSVLNFEEYTTLLYEVEALINSRPISVIYDRVDEGEPLSPSMLMRGRSLVQVPPLYEVNVQGNPPQMCLGRLKYLEKLKTYFWNRWQREYLADLREIHSRRKVGTQLRQPAVNDMVLVRNEKLPRGTWKVGRVIDLKPGRDGSVRSVIVRVVQGKKRNSKGKPIKTVDLNRSPSHLVPLLPEE